MKLEGRTALVTGGSRGIGRAISKALAQEGAAVAINYLSNSRAAEELQAEIQEFGGRAILAPADISDFPDTYRMAQQVLEEFGHLDILINNAGVTSDKTFVNMDHATWRKVLSINLDGVFNCTKVFVDGMVEQNYGRVVNITSVIGQIGNFGQANYAASKAGVAAMTKSLAKELAGKGINVNAVAPGFIETEMVTAIPERVQDRLLNSDSPEAVRQGGGGGADGGVPVRAGGRLRDRRGAGGERRVVHVGAAAISRLERMMRAYRGSAHHRWRCLPGCAAGGSRRADANFGDAFVGTLDFGSAIIRLVHRARSQKCVLQHCIYHQRASDRGRAMTTKNAAENDLAKFQNLLRELFQFDCADLDFGIYRIMNHKRDVVERVHHRKAAGRRGSYVSFGRRAPCCQTSPRPGDPGGSR